MIFLCVEEVFELNRKKLGLKAKTHFNKPERSSCLFMFLSCLWLFTFLLSNKDVIINLAFIYLNTEHTIKII